MIRQPWITLWNESSTELKAYFVGIADLFHDFKKSRSL